jgi:hypothetical protein
MRIALFRPNSWLASGLIGATSFPAVDPGEHLAKELEPLNTNRITQITNGSQEVNRGAPQFGEFRRKRRRKAAALRAGALWRG